MEYLGTNFNVTLPVMLLFTSQNVICIQVHFMFEEVFKHYLSI